MKKTLLLALALIAVGCSEPPDGPYEFYHDNGQLESKGTFKDGEFDGLFERYDRNGELLDRGTLRDGKECGEWLEEGEAVTYDPC